LRFYDQSVADKIPNIAGMYVSTLLEILHAHALRQSANLQSHFVSTLLEILRVFLVLGLGMRGDSFNPS